MSTVIFVHGFAASADQWKFLSACMSESGIPTASVNLLGHGHGAHPPHTTSYSTARMIDQLARDIDLITQDKIILIGHSLGGYLSLDYAHHYPHNIDKLVLINPLYRKDQIFRRLYTFIHFVKIIMGKRNSFPTRVVRLAYPLSMLSHPVYNQEARKILNEGLAQLSPKVFNSPESWGDLTGILPDIQTPTLLLWSDSDRTLNPQMYPVLAHSLTHSKAYCLEGEDHNPHLTQPEWLWSVISDFLENGTD